MSRNGSGTYVLPAGNPVVTGTVITSTWANTTLSDIATALTGSLASDGQTVVTGNIQMGNNRITGMADGIAATDAATLGQISNANITSGTINGAVIGNVNPQNGKFTNLIATVTSTAPTVAITDISTSVATTQFVSDYFAAQPNLPSGIIAMWSGAIANVPAEWVLCDGQNGTPDLRDRFIVGAGTTYAVNATGGSADAIVVAHTHAVNASGTTSATDINHTHSGTTDGMNANNPHSHGVNDPGHSHIYTYSNGGSQPNGYIGSNGNLQGNTSHQVTGVTVAASDINHGHGFTSGYMNQNNTHTHTFDASGNTSSTGSSGINANLPPYYALAYIMKL